RLAGSADALFAFTGSSEAQLLNVTLSRLNLESASAGAGIAIRARNFQDLFLQHISVNHFNVGVWADWGIGLHLYGCGISRNVRGLQIGGSGAAGGIRNGD